MSNLSVREVLLDLLAQNQEMFQWLLSDISEAAMQWQPNPAANNIAVTTWHVARSLDILAHRILVAGQAEDELWLQNGWAKKLNYYPAGIGFAGFGNVAGYTLEERDAIPPMSSELLLAYYCEVSDAVKAFIREMDLETLLDDAPGITQYPQTNYLWIRNFLNDGREHIGEIRALLAQWEQQA